MNQRKWEDDKWDTLIRTIYRGDCILMLGPDASLEMVGDKAVPLAEILAGELMEKLEPKPDPFKIENSDLSRVAHYYERQEGINGLGSKVADFYEKRSGHTSELHADLAELPFYFAITSSPDNMYYNALKNIEKDPQPGWYNFRGTTRDIDTMGSAQKPLLYNLYGCIEEPYSLVVSENDLIDFLVSVVSENPSLPENIVSQLQESRKSFLFLGFGFEHWYLRVLLHVLHGGKRQTHSFALEQFSKIDNVSEFQQSILYFEECECKIHIYNQELDTFVKELRERYEKWLKEKDKPDPPPREIKSPAVPTPKVFICHANEDKEFAQMLYKKFEEVSFEPWLDKENIRGGDEWDTVIRTAIDKGIDYFVVLQSQALLKRIEGYVHKEINKALDRQEAFKRGIRFIIPVKIDECESLEPLDHLHFIDLSNRENIDQLINTIRRDYYKKRNGEG